MNTNILFSKIEPIKRLGIVTEYWVYKGDKLDSIHFTKNDALEREFELKREVRGL